MTDQVVGDAAVWPTAISDTAENRIRLRGYPIEELMGSVSFGDGVCLVLRGELPDQATSALLNAALLASMDHGPGSPSANTARLVASTGGDAGHAAAAGLLAINQFHGAAVAGSMEFLHGVVSEWQRSGDLGRAASAAVAEAKAASRRIPGFGHRVHSKDPRVARLFGIAAQHSVAGDHTTAAEAVEVALRRGDRSIPLNLDGAIAAILCDLGWPTALGNALFMIGRYVGLVAQAAEEASRMGPMRRIRPDLAQYDGPALRHLPDPEPDEVPM